MGALENKSRIFSSAKMSKFGCTNIAKKLNAKTIIAFYRSLNKFFKSYSHLFSLSWLLNHFVFQF